MKHSIVASLITNPGQIIQFPITVTQMAMDFASRILKLVV